MSSFFSRTYVGFQFAVNSSSQEFIYKFAEKKNHKKES